MQKLGLQSHSESTCWWHLPQQLLISYHSLQASPEGPVHSGLLQRLGPSPPTGPRSGTPSPQQLAHNAPSLISPLQQIPLSFFWSNQRFSAPKASLHPCTSSSASLLSFPPALGLPLQCRAAITFPPSELFREAFLTRSCGTKLTTKVT